MIWAIIMPLSIVYRNIQNNDPKGLLSISKSHNIDEI